MAVYGRCDNRVRAGQQGQSGKTTATTTTTTITTTTCPFIVLVRASWNIGIISATSITSHIPIIAQRFHTHYRGKPTLLNRRYRETIQKQKSGIEPTKPQRSHEVVVVFGADELLRKDVTHGEARKRRHGLHQERLGGQSLVVRCPYSSHVSAA